MSGSGIRLRFAIGIFGALTLCSVAHSATLQGSEWTPLSLREVPLTATSPVFVQFASKGRLLGFGGCNRLFADYQTGAGNTIFIGPVAAAHRTSRLRYAGRQAGTGGGAGAGRGGGAYRVRALAGR